MKTKLDNGLEKMTPVGKASFIICVGVGTLLLLGFILTKADGFAITGFYLLIFGSVANLLLLIFIFIHAYILNENKSDFLIATGWVLLIIPFAIGYAALGMNLMNLYENC